MGGKYKKPGQRAISHRFRMNPKYTKEYNRIMSVGKNASSSINMRAVLNAELGELNSKWQGGNSAKGEFQVVGKKLCHQLRKGLHWCNYYRDDNTYFQTGRKKPTDPRTGTTAYPYKSVISRCVLRHAPDASCVKWEHSRIQPRYRINRKTQVPKTDEHGH